MNISKKFNKKVRAKLLLMFRKYNINIKYTKQKTSEFYQYKCKTSYITMDDLKTLQKAIQNNTIDEKEVFNNKHKAFINKCVNSIVNNTDMDLDKKEYNNIQASLFLGHSPQWLTVLKNKNHPMYRFMRFHGKGDLLAGAKAWEKYIYNIEMFFTNEYYKHDNLHKWASFLYDNGYRIRWHSGKKNTFRNKSYELIKITSILNKRVVALSLKYDSTKNSRDIIRLTKRINNDT